MTSHVTWAKVTLLFHVSDKLNETRNHISSGFTEFIVNCFGNNQDLLS